MEKTKSIISFLIVIFVSFTSCTSVSVTKHPAFNYAPTNPTSVIIYDRLTPIYPFIIIGRIDIKLNRCLPLSLEKGMVNMLRFNNINRSQP